jgi:NAD(P)-dependent dehydrogenase (short-subunit alcohol dehydrogenase family)
LVIHYLGREVTMSPVALVSGASRGIGRAIALALADAGFDVGVGYRSNEQAASHTAELITAMGRRSMTHGANLSDAVNAEAIVEACVDRLGTLDVLVANAGRLVDIPFVETSQSDYDLQMNTNVRGTFFLVQAAARRMVTDGTKGRIVVITSDAAVRSYNSLSVYAMTKAACRMLVESAARELAPHGITVNAVAPGTTETDMNREALADPQQRKDLLGSILLGRPGAPEDVAHAVVFLSSPEAAFVTGTTLAVDGGASIH